MHVHTYTQIYGDAPDVMSIVVGNGLNEPSSIPGRDCLHFV